MRKLTWALIFLLLGFTAGAETIGASLAVIRQAVINGDQSTFYQRVDLPSIVGAEVDRAFSKMAGNASKKLNISPADFLDSLPTKIMKNGVQSAAVRYFSKEINQTLQLEESVRRAAVNSFQIKSTKQKGKVASLTASYSVTGAAETVGLTLTQNKAGAWIVTGLDSQLLKESVDRFLH